jgi:AAA domain-containing protein/Toprim domain-containing protein
VSVDDRELLRLQAQITPAIIERLGQLRGWTYDAIVRLGLGFDGKRVVIPVYAQSGEFVGVTRYQPNPERRSDREPKMIADSGGTRELFPPPEFIDDDEPLDRVLALVEGEPDALRLWSLGIPAVGVPGVQSWKDAWASRFSGQGWKIVVCFDCDDAGRMSATKVATALANNGVDVRVLDLAPERDDSYDVSDFFARASVESENPFLTDDAERERAQRLFRSIVDELPLYRSSAKGDVPTADERSSNSDSQTSPATSAIPWRAQRWPEFRDTTPDEHQWLVDGLLPEGALVFVAGPPKKGKTWLGLGLALATATATSFLDEYRVDEARDVLYVALEGSRVGIRARLGALARGLERDPDSDALDRLHVLYRPRPFDLVDAEQATKTWLGDEVARVDAALVVIDVLRAAARFKENEQSDFQRVRDALDPLLEAGRSVALLHHFGKLNDTQQQRSPGERMAGTGAMYGALDVGFLITRSESGARRMRVDLEARDFAAPDALGVVVVGTGSGEHGGFTYVDSATLALDATAAEERDLVDEIETLFTDEIWRTVSEVADANKNGIGANIDEVRAALSSTPDRFVMVEASRVGRHANAKPWGTHAMLARLTPTLESDESDAFEAQPKLSVESCDSPYGGESPSHTFDRQPTFRLESDEQTSQTPVDDVDDASTATGESS